MRKPRVIAVALSVLWVIALAACSNPTAEPNGARPVQGDPTKNTDPQPTERQPGPLEKVDFQIQGIGIGTPVEEVKKRLGDPTSTDYVNGIGADVLIYGPTGLKIFYYRVTGLVTGWSIQENSKIETRRGIRVGATKEEVIAAYGANTSSRSDKTHIFYSSPDNPKVLLGFDIFDGKVRTIAAGGIPFVW